MISIPEIEFKHILEVKFFSNLITGTVYRQKALFSFNKIKLYWYVLKEIRKLI